MLYTKEVSIAIDLSNMDEVIMKYIHLLANQLNIETVNLIHVIPSILSPENKDIPMRNILGLGFNLNQRIIDHIIASSDKIFTNGIDTEINLLEGNPYQTLINQVEDSDTDLLVIGKKIKSDFSGIKTLRVVRDFKGYLLFIPEDVSMKINRISVPIDFSDNSGRALKAALSIANRMKDCSVRAVHAINGIPEKYYLDLKTKRGIRTQMLSNAEKAWDLFLAKNEIKEDTVPIDFTGDMNATNARLLNDYFEAHNTDMVIMGAKGHTAFEKFLYGSVTENLVETISKHSILVVR